MAEIRAVTVDIISDIETIFISIYLLKVLVKTHESLFSGRTNKREGYIPEPLSKSKNLTKTCEPIKS